MTNQRISDNTVLDLGEDDKIVGIELLDVSKHLSLEKLLPVNYEPVKLLHWRQGNFLKNVDN